MKRALIGFTSILVVLAFVLLVAPGFFDWNQYKPQAISLIKEKTGLDIVLNGDVKVALLPTPYAYVSDVKVKSPSEGNYNNLATLRRLDLNLAFAPLLSGKIDFTSVEFVKPSIYIEIYADGRQNWKTDEIKRMMEGDKAAQDAAQKTVSNDNPLLDAISLNQVKISEGRFSFYNHQNQSEQVVDNITATMRADTLSGPFTIDGSVRHGSRAIKFEAKTGRLDGDSGSVPLNAQALLSPDDLELRYSGIVDFSDAFEVQGETQLRLNDVAEFLSGFGVASPVLKSSSLNAKGLLSATSEGFTFQNSSIAVGKSEFSGSINGTFSPMRMDVDLNSERLNLLSSFDIPALGNVNAASVKGSVQLLDSGVQAQNMVLKLDDTALQGSLNYDSTAARPKISFVLRSDNLDMNKFISAPLESGSSSVSGSQASELKEGIAQANLPFDLDIDVNIAKGRYGDYTFSGVTAKGGVSDSTVNIGTLSIKDFAGSAISAQGAIDNYRTLSGVDVTLSVDTDNIRKLGSVLAVDLSSMPTSLEALEARIRLAGSVENMDVTANIKAINGELIANGVVGNVLDAMTISNLDLQVRHSNFNQALNSIQPGMGAFDSLNKPLDFYARVSRSSGGYDLTDIKATVSGIQATGNIGLDLSKDKPFMNGTLNLGDVVIGNKAAGGRNINASRSGGATNQNDRWSRETLDSKWMNAMNFDVSIMAKSINYEGWAMARPSLKVSLDSGKLDLDQLQAGLYEGQLNLSGTLKPFNDGGGYTIDGNANLRDVSLEPLVGSLTGNRILQGQGAVNSDTQIGASGLSMAALVSSLEGKGTLTGRDIILTGFDLARFARALSSETKPGDTALGVWKSATRGGNTKFDTMDGEFTINEGIVNISSIKMDGPKAFMDTTGTVNVPEFTIATTHTINLKGEDVPEFSVNIKGPLNNPAQTFGQGVLNDYISRKVNRKLQDIITDKFGDKLGIPKTQSQSGGESDAQTEQDGPVERDVKPAANDNNEGERRQPADIKPEDAIKGLLQGLLKQ